MKRYEPHCLAVISGWEFTALVFGVIPTITTLVGHLPPWGRRAVAFGAGVWLWRHFDGG